MKQLIPFLFVLVLLSTGCKKDAGKSKETFLSEVRSDGALSARIYYTAANKLSRYESYTGNAVNAYLSFEYDGSGHIAEVSSVIMPGDIPVVRIIMQCNAAGRLTSAANYDLLGPTPNIPISLASYFYNAEGLLNKIERRDHNGVFISRINLLYFPDGNLKETQTFKEANNQLWMSAKSIFSVPNGFYPKGVDQLKMMLGPDFTANLFSEAIHDYTYDQNGGMLTHRSRLMSGREFNADGSLKKQLQTSKSVKPPQPEVESHMDYAYVLQ